MPGRRTKIATRRARAMNRNSGNGRSQSNNGLAYVQELGNTRQLPPMTSMVDSGPRYNPTWNPQYLKVARTFQYSAPAADFGAGFGKVQDPAVGPSATLLNYNSGALSFAISDIPSVSEYGSLFDQYRIAAVKLVFDFMSFTETVNPITSGSQQQVSLMMYEDNDDGTAPTASNTGWQACYENGRAVRAVFPNRLNQVTYTLKPKYLIADVDSSAGVTGRSLGAGWVDGATGLDVVWRGLKWILQSNPAATTNNYAFRVTATYYTEWRARQ